MSDIPHETNDLKNLIENSNHEQSGSNLNLVDLTCRLDAGFPHAIKASDKLTLPSLHHAARIDKKSAKEAAYGLLGSGLLVGVGMLPYAVGRCFDFCLSSYALTAEEAAMAVGEEGVGIAVVLHGPPGA